MSTPLISHLGPLLWVLLKISLLVALCFRSSLHPSVPLVSRSVYLSYTFYHDEVCDHCPCGGSRFCLCPAVSLRPMWWYQLDWQDLLRCWIRLRIPESLLLPVRRRHGYLCKVFSCCYQALELCDKARSHHHYSSNQSHLCIAYVDQGVFHL